MNNLSPQQFVADAAGFHKWAGSRERQIRDEHEVSPGHISFKDDRDAGRKVSRLEKARVDLVESAAWGYHSGTHDGLHQPLHELLPDHHDLVNEYLEGNR